ncbi:MAG: hypothetical protein JXA25_01300 [Anaerolineales bacterium]|nr:hypothetical protein [Anaerolineales bacterium]
MSRLSNLNRLQDIDLRIKSIQSRLSAIVATLADSTELDRRRTQAAKAEAELSTAKVSLHSAEHDVTMHRQKIAASEHKLYSGTVKNPKELEDIQNELASLKRYLETLEDQQLEAMIFMEEAEKLFTKNSEAVEIEEIKTSSSHKSLLGEKGTLEKELDKLAIEKEAALTVIQVSDIEIYTELQQRLGSNVISTISDGSCSICGMVVAGSTVQAVRTGNEIHRCSQCSRILYAG